MKQLTDLYQAILISLGLQINEQGVVELMEGDTPRPVTVSGRKLILPTTEVLRSYNPEYHIAFHPLSESVVRGQSPVIKKLRQIAMFRVQASLQLLLEELMKVAADPSKHSKLPPAAVEMLRAVPDADAKTAEVIEDVLGKVNGEEYKLVNFYLRQGGMVGGQVVQRATIVTFPFMKEFENAEHQMFGVKMRKKDRVAIQALFNWVLPNAHDTDTYSFGSNSATAPYFHALIHAYIKMAERINEVAKHFKKLLPPEIHIPLEFAKDVHDLTPYRDLLPALSGNDGDVTNEPAKATIQPPPAPAPTLAPAAPPMVAAPPTMPTFIAPGVPAPTPVAEQYGGIKPLGASGTAAAEAAKKGTVKVNPDFNPEVAEWDRIHAIRTMPQLAFMGQMGMPMMPTMPVMQPQFPWLNNGQPQQPTMPVYPQPGYPNYAYPAPAPQPAAPVYPTAMAPVGGGI